MAQWSRRKLLFTSVGAWWMTQHSARAIGASSETSIGRLRHSGRYDVRPEGLRRLLWEAGKRTSIQVARDAVDVSLSGDDAPARALFEQPLLWMTGEGDFAPFSVAERARLERHLRFGGMWVIDAPSASDAFAAAARREVAAILPQQPLAPLPTDHVVYKSFYLLDRAIGKTDDDKNLHGVELDGRLTVLLSNNDLLGALERDRLGNWRFACEPDGEQQREMAFRLATNILMYATCLDYKADQVHIPFIMKKKRR